MSKLVGRRPVELNINSLQNNAIPVYDGTNKIWNTVTTASLLSGSVSLSGSNTLIGNQIISGSLTVVNGITGDLTGTASFAILSATASSADDFNVRNTLTAQLVSSSTSYITTNTRNGSFLNNNHQFTGSVFITGALEINGRNYINDSSSFANRINANSSSFVQFSGSYVSESSSFDNRIDENSASISLLSSSYTNTSASFSDRITTNNAAFISFSGSYINDSSSFVSRITTNSASISSISASFLSFSSSYNTGSFTGSFTGSVIGSLIGTSSYASQALTASNANTASSADDFTVRGTLTAQTLVVQTITSSTEFITGSTKNGSLLSNTHQFTGSVSVTGSLTVNGSDYITTSGSASTRLTALEAFSGSSSTGSFTGSFIGRHTGSFSGSLYNLQNTVVGHIPFYSSSQVLADSIMRQIDNGSGSFSIVINQDGVSAEAPEALYVWQPSSTSYNVISGKGNLDNYLQLNIQNSNTGPSASSDVVATANNGTETSYYVDMGINGDGYINNGNGVGNANDAYLYSTGNHLHIGNASNSYVGFFAGGFDVDANMKLLLSPDNKHEVTGSLTVTEGVTASLQGTASYTIQALSASYWSGSIINAATASYVLNAISSSYATSASFIEGISNGTASYSVTSSFALSALTASNSNTASYVLNAQSASYWSGSIINASSASYAVNAVSSSYPFFVTGSQYGINTSIITNMSTGSYPDLENVVFIGKDAGANKNFSINEVAIGFEAGKNTNNVFYSTLIGHSAGFETKNAEGLIGLGKEAGAYSSQSRYITAIGYLAGANIVKTEYSIGIGTEALNSASSSINITAVGDYAGKLIKATENSTFLGKSAGYYSVSSSYSTFIGDKAGYGVKNASSSIFIGVNTGRGPLNPLNPGNTLGRNNIIIGTNITLPPSASDSINIAGILFGSGSYYRDANDPAYFSGSANGKIGINQPTPLYSLDVSGSGNYSNGLTVTGSLVATSFTGSLLGTASVATSAATASSADNFTVRGTLTAQNINVQTITSSVDFVTGSSINGSLLTNTHQFTGSVSITGSLIVNNSEVIRSNQTSSMSVATASYVLNAVSSSFASTASYVLNAVSSSFASTASSVNRLNQNVVISGSLTVTGSTNIVGNSGTTLLSSNADTLVFTGSLFTTGSIISTGSLNILGGITGSLLGTASYATQALSASYWSGSIINAATASYVQTAQTASYVLNAVSASHASTASYLNPINNSYLVLSQVSQSLNFADDAAAAAGGVPLGGLYRNGNFILIRIV